MNAVYEIASVSKSNHHKIIKGLKSSKDSKSVKCVDSWSNTISTERKDNPAAGLRNIYESYSPSGIGRDAFLRWGKSQGYMLEPKKAFIKTTYSDNETDLKNKIEDKELNDVNQVWTSDITYVFSHGALYYLVTIMDLFSRRIIGYNLSKTLKAEKSVSALSEAIKLRNIPNYDFKLIHHSDRGSQYTSGIYQKKLLDYKITQSVCFHVWDNAYHERVQGTLKNDYIYRWHASNEKELHKVVAKAVNNYNKRKHSSLLNKMSPIEFEDYISKLTVEERPVMDVFCVSDLEVTKDSLLRKIHRS
jgi:putative transposase